jgi:serine/threonine protein kinase
MRFHVEEIFHALADLSVDARARYFAEHHIDVNTQLEVQALLAFDARSTTSTLDREIGNVAIGALTRLHPQDLPCGPYRLGNLLGRGGMGSVYSAERVDGEVAQRVAVKLLRPGADDPPTRQRFLAERQILAPLSHPNIARLLDAGHREDGQPYLAMEYVEGKTIDVYAAGQTIQCIVTLFLKVCAAVSYLHRNLVVHRDLKPSNILVTDEGEPKLLDFGIAKLLDLTTDTTMTGMSMLTPDYASPEQVNGGPITTATDIYSLGAVLYKLLTGKAPHQFEGDSAGEIATAISDGKITLPSKLAPGLKGDLEIVLMKALRKEPQERYVSVDAFADDLRACLEWRPVQARSGDVWYRTRRWLRHYWVPAAAATLAIAGLSTGLYIANQQREIAERRFAQLRQLSNNIIDLDRSIRTLPGSVAARQRLVAVSLEYLEGLAREAHDNPDLAQEIATGYWRMARIQGVNAEFNLGDTAKAEDSLKKADGLIGTVVAARPHDRSALFRAAVIAHDRMLLGDAEDRRADTLAHARKTIDRLGAFQREPETGTPVRLEGFLRTGDARRAERIGAATLYSNIALTYVNIHVYEEGVRYARRAVEIAQSIPSSQDVTCSGLSVLANALRYQGDLEGALIAIRQARELAEHAAYASETARMFTLYGVLLREGRILGEEDEVNLGRPAEAIEILQKAVDMLEAAARKDANDSASRGRVGTSSRQLGDILRERDPQRALAVYDLGIQRLGEMRTSVKARRDRAQLLAKSSYVLLRLHRPAEAKSRIDAAVGLLEATKNFPAERLRIGSYEYAIYCAIANREAETGDPGRALENYEEILRKVMAAAPQPETSLPDAVLLSHFYTEMADASRRAGREDRTAELKALRLELWRHWDQRLPHNTFVRRQLDAANA